MMQCKSIDSPLAYLPICKLQLLQNNTSDQRCKRTYQLMFSVASIQGQALKNNYDNNLTIFISFVSSENFDQTQYNQNS